MNSATLDAKALWQGRQWAFCVGVNYYQDPTITVEIRADVEFYRITVWFAT
jgi:hypothetical protein